MADAKFTKSQAESLNTHFIREECLDQIHFARVSSHSHRKTPLKVNYYGSQKLLFIYKGKLFQIGFVLFVLWMNASQLLGVPNIFFCLI